MSNIHTTEARFLSSCFINGDVQTFASVDKHAFATQLGVQIYEFALSWNSQHGKLPSLERIKSKFGMDLPPTKETPAECLTDLKNNAKYVSTQTLYRDLTALFAKCVQDEKTEEETGQLVHALTQKSLERLAQAFSSNREVLVGDDKFQTRYLDVMCERRNRGGMLPIQYPWPSANRATLGIDNGQLIAIVGRPGDGKTSLTISMLCHFYPMVDGRIMVVSNEINAISVTDRIVATTLKVPYADIRAGNIHDDEIVAALETYKANPIAVLDSEMLGAGTLDAIKAKARQEKTRLLIIDGAYLMKATGKDMYASAAAISQELKSISMSLGIPVIITWQLNRQAGDGSGASTATVAFSDRLSTDADVIIAIFGTPDMIANNQRVIRSIKVRDGSPFEFSINCNYDTMDFSEIVIEDSAPITGGFLTATAQPTEDMI